MSGARHQYRTRIHASFEEKEWVYVCTWRCLKRNGHGWFMCIEAGAESRCTCERDHCPAPQHHCACDATAVASIQPDFLSGVSCIVKSMRLCLDQPRTALFQAEVPADAFDAAGAKTCTGLAHAKTIALTTTASR
eukprot:570721-Rhodomonas_salina.1